MGEGNVILYLDLSGFAARLGLSHQTLRKYRANPGFLPEPDAYIGGNPGWLPETVDRWQAGRPGHGGRPRKEVT